MAGTHGTLRFRAVADPEILKGVEAVEAKAACEWVANAGSWGNRIFNTNIIFCSFYTRK